MSNLKPSKTIPTTIVSAPCEDMFKQEQHKKTLLQTCHPVDLEDEVASFEDLCKLLDSIQ